MTKRDKLMQPKDRELAQTQQVLTALCVHRCSGFLSWLQVSEKDELVQVKDMGLAQLRHQVSCVCLRVCMHVYVHGV